MLRRPLLGSVMPMSVDDTLGFRSGPSQLSITVNTHCGVSTFVCGQVAPLELVLNVMNHVPTDPDVRRNLPTKVESNCPLLQD